MTRPDEATFIVSEDADVILAGRQARALLNQLKFDEAAIEDLVLVVHELASNIVKHAGEGSVTLVPMSDGGRSGIEIHAHDSGPGIANVNQAIVDGYSTVGSLGGGLGAVYRLMDEVIIKSNDNSESGVQIVATRWSSAASTEKPTPPLTVDAATQPQPGNDQNGDAFLIEQGTGQTLVGVIDGLGHGESAHRAASAAQQHVKTHSTQPITELFAGVEQACRDTRGVVMLLARFDWSADEITLGSVGNITVRVCHSPESLHLVPKRGVVGGNAPSPMIDEWDWNPAFVMVVHTDGLTSKWRCDEFSLNSDNAETTTADELLQTLWKQDDDATVLIIRGTEQ